MNRTLPIASQPVARASVPPTSDNVITIPNDTRIFMTVLLFAGPVHEAHYTRGKPPLLDRLPPRAWVQEVSRRSLSGSTSCENRRHEFCLRVTVPRHMAPATNSATARIAATSSTGALTAGLRDIPVCPAAYGGPSPSSVVQSSYG